jgi:hypothetical protein
VLVGVAGFEPAPPSSRTRGAAIHCYPHSLIAGCPGRLRTVFQPVRPRVGADDAAPRAHHPQPKCRHPNVTGHGSPISTAVLGKKSQICRLLS